jgi:hypothetical protein
MFFGFVAAPSALQSLPQIRSGRAAFHFEQTGERAPADQLVAVVIEL